MPHPVAGKLDMERTDLVLNLTRLSLYGIYNNSSNNINSENEQVEEYIENEELHIKAARRPSQAEPPSQAFSAAKLALVPVAAFLYNQITRNISTSHVDSYGEVISSYLARSVDRWKPFSAFAPQLGLTVVDDALFLFLEGLLLSIILPVLDRLAPNGLRRLLSLHPDPYRRSNLVNDLLRLAVTFLGISYAIRHIEWRSLLQMALSWSLVNPALWILLDGTVNGFVASAAVATVASGGIYLQNSSTFTRDRDGIITILLYVASFFFCGVIIFGKLGRFVFGRRL